MCADSMGSDENKKAAIRMMPLLCDGVQDQFGSMNPNRVRKSKVCGPLFLNQGMSGHLFRWLLSH